MKFTIGCVIKNTARNIRKRLKKPLIGDLLSYELAFDESKRDTLASKTNGFGGRLGYRHSDYLFAFVVIIIVPTTNINIKYQLKIISNLLYNLSNDWATTRTQILEIKDQSHLLGEKTSKGGMVWLFPIQHPQKYKLSLLLRPFNESNSSRFRLWIGLHFYQLYQQYHEFVKKIQNSEICFIKLSRVLVQFYSHSFINSYGQHSITIYHVSIQYSLNLYHKVFPSNHILYYIQLLFVLLLKKTGMNEYKLMDRRSRPQKQVFETVLHKHFQIIQTFLDKINALYLKNEELETSHNNMAQRISQIEESASNIHYEFRTTHMQIDKKINHMNNQYKNIQEQLTMIKQNVPFDQSLKSMHFSSKTANFQHINRKTSRTNFIDSNKGPDHQNTYQNDGNINFKNLDVNYSPHLPPSISSIAQLHPQNQNWQQSSKLNQNQNQQQSSKLNITNNQQQPNYLSPSIFQTTQKAIRTVTSQYLMEYFQQCPEPLHNIITDKFLHFTVGLEQRLIQKLEKQVEERVLNWGSGLLKQWQNGLKEEKGNISAQFAEKTKDMDIQSQERWSIEMKRIEDELLSVKDTLSRISPSRAQIQIQSLQENFNKNIGILEEKMQSKVQSTYFQESMNNMSVAISYELNNIHKYMPNRLQTHRAINFLQKKINKLIEGQRVEGRPSKTNKQMEEGPLRVHRCDSQRQQGLSERSIRDKCYDQVDQNYNKSLNSSIVEKQLSINRSNSSLTRLECQINWKKISHLEKFKQPRQGKRSITKTTKIPVCYSSKNSGSSMVSFQDKQMSSKQWADKVVKVLNLGDRKRMKVTFK